MKILLIEDEQQLAEVLSILLMQNLHQVDIANNGPDGETMALTAVYDAIILDIMLPGKNGIDVLRSLRLQKNATPVLLLTAKSELDDRVQGLDAGADDYLAKPFATAELLARLRAITRRKEEYVGDELIIGNTTLDRNTHEVHAPQGSVRLASKEYQILELLFLNNRQIIPKERFFTRIWGYESDAEYNTVEVYVSFVRKKLTAIGSDIQIKAVRNTGYELEVSR